MCGFSEYTVHHWQKVSEFCVNFQELCTFFFPFKILCLIKTEFLLTKLKFNTWLTSDESEEENQLEDYLMIQHQILQTNIM